VERGDIFGHEFMGQITEVGSEVKELKVGDRIIVPFIISCGECEFCAAGKTSLCDRSNPNHEIAEKFMGYSPAALYGYSHMLGGYCGGQAEYARVAFAETSVFKVPEGIPDEKLLFLTDIFPTGWMAAENADIPPGGTVAIWGAGPVGQFAIRSAFLQGAGRVIAIDRVPERLQMARDGGAETIDYEEDEKVSQALKEMTDGRGPDACIDAVGMEAHGAGGLGGVMNVYDKVKQAVQLESDRPGALRQILYCARKGSTVSVPGVYVGLSDKFPFGWAFNKGLTLKMGQTHVQKYVPLLLELIESGKIDPSFVITHRLPLSEAPKGYDLFKHKEDGCIKVVLTP
jgi:threonine dehydrogenase-like Zn-dependent dehydrogenase